MTEQIMTEKMMRKIMNAQVDLPCRKIVYMMSHKTLVDGLWGVLKAYKIEHTKESHELLVEIVQEKLEGPDFEREWTEEEYKNFVEWKQ